MFGRDARTRLDSITPAVDGVKYRGGLDAFVADERQAVRELRQVVEEGHAAQDRAKEGHNDSILLGRASPGGASQGR